MPSSSKFFHARSSPSISQTQKSKILIFSSLLIGYAGFLFKLVAILRLSSAHDCRKVGDVKFDRVVWVRGSGNGNANVNVGVILDEGRKRYEVMGFVGIQIGFASAIVAANLSRFLHLLRTFFTILRRRKLSFFQLFNQSILICMFFLWLEFSQSFQVIAILLTTAVYSVVYGYRFWVTIGLPMACFPFVVNCHIVLLGCNLICHVGVLLFYVLKGGCNGIGAWLFNSVLNGVILFLFLKFYMKEVVRFITKNGAALLVEDESTHSCSRSEEAMTESTSTKENFQLCL